MKKVLFATSVLASICVHSVYASDMFPSISREMDKKLEQILELQRLGDLDITVKLSPNTPLNSRNAEVARTVFKANVRIVGGVATTIEENPWQVALVFGSTPDAIRQQFCGGSIIKENVILTAAHCVDWIADASGVDVISGTTYYGFDGNRSKVSSFKIHPNWNPNSRDNDFALLFLENNVSLGSQIDIISAEETLTPEQEVVVSGWGKLSEGGQSSQILMHVAVPVVANQTCNQASSYNGRITGNMFCAGERDGGYDACQGDSGGPVYSKFNGNPKLVGVVSWGEGCARALKYGVYSRISKALAWINSSTQ